MNHTYLLTPSILRPVAVCLALLAFSNFSRCSSPIGDEQRETNDQVAARIDALLQRHWKANEVQPAQSSDDVTFLRRVTLDLAGRIPTIAELDQFLKDKSAEKRQKLIDRLINSPDFSLHFGNVLDQMIQGRYAGDANFVSYLRQSLRERKSWSGIFRELMVGPWKGGTAKAANKFLDKRARKPEMLTAEATRVFFGVDVSCAKCHDHPLVPDWKQDHFYGMMAFFIRTTGGKGKVGEKRSGEVKFLKNGKETTAKMMFLSGSTLEEPVRKTASKSRKPYSRREQLVRIALEDRKYFSRAMVNRLWNYFFGRGLVHPIDQMHSGNAAVVPELLDWLAQDFARSEYDMHRLIAGIVSSRAYQLSSRGKGEEGPRPSTFAVAHLRPLSQKQFALSLVLATGEGNIGTKQKRTETYLALERQAKGLTPFLDPRRSEHQSTSSEALFLSNHPTTQKLVSAEGNNLVVRLSRLKKTQEIITTAFRTVLSRSPEKEELDELVRWFGSQKQSRQKTCEQLVWALITSAEFRFNH